MRYARAALLLACLVLLAMAAAIQFGGPPPLPALPSVNDPFESVDFSSMPPLGRFTARDGVRLAYRAYIRPGARGSVVLIHGSSARSNSMHPLAQGFADAGYAVYALDIRGHGESGSKGRIAYVGQLEDDLEDFMKAVKPAGVKSLVGFSAGGGFALRFAADKRRALFDNYLLLSPFLSQSASTYRPASGGWVSVGLPRFVAIAILNRIGITWLNDMPVTTYALSETNQKILTPNYSYALSVNFRPDADYRGDIIAASQPMHVLVGSVDDEFFPNRFASEFAIAKPPVGVTVIPGVGHIGLTLSPVAIAAAVTAVSTLDSMSATHVRPL
jgi:non-heme chloroperoxidase